MVHTTAENTNTKGVMSIKLYSIKSDIKASDNGLLKIIFIPKKSHNQNKTRKIFKCMNINTYLFFNKFHFFIICI